MAWRIAKSLETLRDEINQRWPNRNKASDGVIGDAAHAASASDHNPNAQNVVCAFDITHDPNGPDGTYLAELLRTWRHPDVKYVIWDHRIFSAYPRAGYASFEWRPYSGDPHTNHVHVSVGVGTDGKSQPPYDDTTPWGVLVPQQEDDDLPGDPAVLKVLTDISTHLAKLREIADHEDDPLLTGIKDLVEQGKKQQTTLDAILAKVSA